MNTVMPLLRLLITPSTFTSVPGRLMIAAYAATSTMFMVVAGGTWGFFHWEPTGEFSTGESYQGMYRMMASIATILLLVPAFTLSTAAAKLSARRSDTRLSTLSLLGVTRSQITVLAVVEPMVIAAVGVTLGWIAHYLVIIPFSLIPFHGDGLGYQRMLLPPWLIVPIILGLIGVSGLAAIRGLKTIAISPLGVRTRSLPSKFPWKNVVVAVALMVLIFIGIGVTKVMASGIAIAMSIFFTLVILCLVLVNILGGIFVRLRAKSGVRRARTPENLVAARLVCAEPKQYWRRVAAVGMTSFTAVFAGSASAISQKVGVEEDPAMQMVAQDVFTGVLVTLGISFIFIVISAMLYQSADIYDRRTTYWELHAAGMSQESLYTMTVRALTRPLVSICITSAVIGVVLILPFSAASVVLSPIAVGVIIATMVIGIVAVYLGLRVVRPLIRSVTTTG